MGFLVVRPFLFLDLRSVVWFTSSRNGGATTLIALFSSSLLLLPLLSFCPVFRYQQTMCPLAEAAPKPLCIIGSCARNVRVLSRGCEINLKSPNFTFQERLLRILVSGEIQQTRFRDSRRVFSKACKFYYFTARVGHTPDLNFRFDQSELRNLEQKAIDVSRSLEKNLRTIEGSSETVEECVEGRRASKKRGEKRRQGSIHYLCVPFTATFPSSLSPSVPLSIDSSWHYGNFQPQPALLLLFLSATELCLASRIQERTTAFPS